LLPITRCTPCEYQAQRTQQLIVLHFRQQLLPTLVKQIASQPDFPSMSASIFSSNRPPAYELLDEHIALLPDAEGAVGSWFSTAGFHHRSK